ncbi:MAG: twitching motility protein PilT [Actinomycetota bacterium]|nr:twitching motility protein PilT [Actinomycetota bacterium]
MAGVTYDTGALIAGNRNDRRMWALHVGFIAEKVIPVVPAPVLAEAWRGGSRQASLVRMLAGCDFEAMSPDQARRVGELAGRSRLDDVVDVTVVEGAVRRGDDVVVTSNESHIRQVVDAAGGRLQVEAV